MPRKVTEKSEIARLGKIYANLPPKQLALAQGLIIQAARTRVDLDELREDIRVNGKMEPFQQSEKCNPYDRERPQYTAYMKADKSYQAIIKQLNDMLPPEEEPEDDLASFRMGDS